MSVPLTQALERMPRALLIAVLTVCALLTVDAIVWLYVADSVTDYAVVLINSVVIAMVASIYRRKPGITKLVRAIAWVWALFSLAFSFTADFSDPLTSYTSIEGILELPAFLTLYLVLRLQSVRAYLGESSTQDPPLQAPLRSKL